MKNKTRSRVLCRTLCVLLTLVTVFSAVALSVSAYNDSGVYYHIRAQSSGGIDYFGYDYENKKMVTRSDGEENALYFTFIGGFYVEYAGDMWYGSCAKAGWGAPNSSTISNGLLPLGTTHIDNKNDSAKYGAHFTGEHNNENRTIDTDFIFRCWYYARKNYSSGGGICSWTTNCYMQEAVSMAYRCEWDTRVITKIVSPTSSVPNGNAWATLPDNKNFESSVTQAFAVLIDLANNILRDALVDEDGLKGNIKRPDNYTMTFTKNGTTSIMHLLDMNNPDNERRNRQNMFIFRQGTVFEEYNISAKKVDADTGEVLSGATFKIEMKTGSSWTDLNMPLTTESDGIVTWSRLQAGTYRITETAAPSGYQIDTTPQEVTVGSSSSSSVTVTFRDKPDKPPTYSIIIYKYPEGTPHYPYSVFDDRYMLAGAEFTLYKKDGSSWVYQTEKTLKGKGEGLFAYNWNRFSDLEAGEYKIVETKAPPGYELDSTPQYVSFPNSAGDTIVSLYFEDPKSKPNTGAIDVLKHDSSGRPIEGVVFELWLDPDKIAATGISKTTGDDGIATFTGLTPGETYYVFEVKAPAGFIVDPNKGYPAKVVANRTVRVNNGNAIVNYPDTVTWTPHIYKRLTGRDLEDDEFTFVLEESTGSTWKILQTVTNREDGVVPFTWVTYKQSDVGEYKYRVRELAGGDETIDYDGHIVEFTVTVELTDNKLTAKERVSGDTTFNNTYSEPVEPTGEWTPTVTKTLTGRELKDNEFTFLLKEDGRTLQTVKNLGNSVPFEAIYYAKSDVGTHTYTIEEQKGSDPTITYDEHIATYTVEVQLVGDELKVTATMANDLLGLGIATFMNTYTEPAEPTGEWTPSVTKELTGRNLEDNEFTFVLAEDGRELQRKSNLANGTIPFDTIYYAKADIGEHTYTIYEVSGSDPTITYDGHTVTFTVTVSYSGSGTELTVSESVSGDTTFNNIYTEPVEPTGSWTPTVTKELTGRNLEDNEFTFVLKDSEGHTLQTVKNRANGSIPFTAIHYTKSDVGTHTYTVEEQNGSDPTITYDSHKVTFTVTVSYSGSGTELTVSESVSGDTTFNNIYTEPEGYWTPDVFKRYNLDLSGGDFEFILEEDGVGELQRKSNLADGSIPFEAIHYTSADIGTHYYTIREVAGADPLIDYDADPIEFTVVVSDDGSGGLTVSATRTTSVDYFYNTYTEPEGKWEPEVTKELIGRPLSYGEFTFVLEEDGTELQRVQNNADGSIPFTALHYTLADVGYHTYTIREISGSDSTVLYDEHVVTFDVTVEDSGRTLTVMWLTHGETTFTNYALTVTWTPHTSKTLVGRPLQNSEFEFVLKDSSGTVLQTKSNRADGSIVFDPLVFTLADVGTHTYTVEEKNGGDTTLLYDSHVVTFTVTISYTEGDTEMTVLESTSGETTFTNYVAVKIEIEKTDPNGNTLAGAEFLLEWSDDNGSTWHNVFYATTITKGGCSNPDIVDGTVTTGKDGKITFENLYPTLRYRLTETKAPDGMQLLAESAFDGTLPSPEGETTLSLRVVNTETLTLPATGGKGFGGVFAATVLLCGSLCILIGGVRKNKRKDDNK